MQSATSLTETVDTVDKPDEPMPSSDTENESSPDDDDDEKTSSEQRGLVTTAAQCPDDETSVDVEPTQFDVESIILDENKDNNTPNVQDSFEHDKDNQSQSAIIYKIPGATFITQVSSLDSIFDTKLAPDKISKRQRIQTTAQNSHPNCFLPVTASKIHGGVLGKRRYRPRKSYKPIVVQNEVNFPPIRSSHTAPETSRSAPQIVTRKMTIFAKNGPKLGNLSLDLKARRPATEPNKLPRCSRYGRPYYRPQEVQLKSRHDHRKNDGESKFTIKLPTAPWNSACGNSDHDGSESNPSDSHHIRWAIGNSLHLEEDESCRQGLPKRQNKRKHGLQATRPLGLPKIHGGASTTNLSLGDLHIARSKMVERMKASNEPLTDNQTTTALPLL